MDQNSAIQQVDQKLCELSSMIVPLSYLKPKNYDSERDRFFELKKNYSPKFEYREPEYDPAKAKAEIESIEIPDGIEFFSDLLQDFKQDLLDRNTIIANLGNSEIVLQASINLFGKPTLGMIQRAEQILDAKVLDNSEETDPHTINAKDVLDAVADVMQKIGLSHWDVFIDDNMMVITTDNNQFISLPSNTKFTAKKLPGLLIHEVGVHALRIENGHHQPYKIFSQGLPGYGFTEEGLTTYSEVKTGTVLQYDLNNYAGRIIAADSMCNGDSFYKVYEKLMDTTVLTPEQAYQITIRAFRGGGYLKDIIYLGGLCLLEEFTERGGRVKNLFMGKIGLQRLEKVEKLIQEEKLNAPKIDPWFLDELI